MHEQLFSVDVKLDLNNWLSWKPAVRDAIAAAGASEIVTGTETVPEARTESVSVGTGKAKKQREFETDKSRKARNDWSMRNGKACRIIKNSLTSELKDDVEDIDDAKTLWEHLERQCNVQDSALLGSYEEKYYAVKHEPGTNVNTTLSTLQKLAKLVNSQRDEGAELEDKHKVARATAVFRRDKSWQAFAVAVSRDFDKGVLETYAAVVNEYRKEQRERDDADNVDEAPSNKRAKTTPTKNNAATSSTSHLASELQQLSQAVANVNVVVTALASQVGERGQGAFGRGRGRGRGAPGGFRGGGRGGRGRGGAPLGGRSIDLPADVVKKRLDADKCIRCGDADHWKSQCPNAVNDAEVSKPRGAVRAQALTLCVTPSALRTLLAVTGRKPSKRNGAVATAKKVNPNQKRMYADSGASWTVVGRYHRDRMYNVRPVSGGVNIAAEGQSMRIECVGDLDIVTDKGEVMILNNVLYAPEATWTLVSVRQLTMLGEHGKEVVFKAHGKGFELRDAVTGKVDVTGDMVPEVGLSAINEGSAAPVTVNLRKGKRANYRRNDRRRRAQRRKTDSATTEDAIVGPSAVNENRGTPASVPETKIGKRRPFTKRNTLRNAQQRQAAAARASDNAAIEAVCANDIANNVWLKLAGEAMTADKIAGKGGHKDGDENRGEINAANATALTSELAKAFGVSAEDITTKSVAIMDIVDTSTTALATALGVSVDDIAFASANVATVDDAVLWHQRLGHPGKEATEKILSGDHIAEGDSYKDVLQSIVDFCDTCQYAKSTRQPFTKAMQGTRATRAGQRTHIDIAVINSVGIGGAKYFAIFVDDYSRYTTIALLNNKSDIAAHFARYHQRVERLHNTKMQSVRCDNAKEQVEGQFRLYMQQHGLVYEIACAYTPEQDGMAERHIRTVMETARSLLIGAGLRLEFWPYAVMHAAKIKNLIPRSTHPGGKSSTELWDGRKPAIGALRPFGCIVYVHVPKAKRTSKFAPRCIKGIYLGDAVEHSGSICWDPMTGAVTISRDVVFDEKCITDHGFGRVRGPMAFKAAAHDQPQHAQLQSELAQELERWEVTQDSAPGATQDGQSQPVVPQIPPQPQPTMPQDVSQPSLSTNEWENSGSVGNSDVNSSGEIGNSGSIGISGANSGDAMGTDPNTIVMPRPEIEVPPPTVIPQTDPNTIDPNTSVMPLPTVPPGQSTTAPTPTAPTSTTVGSTRQAITSVSKTAAQTPFEPMVTRSRQREMSVMNAVLDASRPDIDLVRSLAKPRVQSGNDFAELDATAPLDETPVFTRHERGLLCAAARQCSVEPKSLFEIQHMSEPDKSRWHEATQQEYDALMENGTWELVPLPVGRKSIKCGWVFKLKRGPDGEVTRYKARLVAKGYSQKEGIDYQETFAPVVKFATFRAMLAIAAALDLDLHQLDVSSAFLNGILQEDIYMNQPEGFEAKGREHLVCKLLKTLYGLKQSSREWNKRIHATLVKMGYAQNPFDHCLYVRMDAQGIVGMIGLWVDDAVVATRKGSGELDRIERELRKEFTITSGGELEWFVGLKIVRDRKKKKIYLSQEAMVKSILERFGMADCNPVRTPLDNDKLSKTMGPKTEKEREEMHNVPYRGLVGALVYLVQATRPDIAVAVSTLSRFLNNPGTTHWGAAKRVLRYLKGTIDVALVIDASKVELALQPSGRHLMLNPVVVYCDADYAGDIDTRRSTYGFITFIGGAASAWKSALQSVVALSTAEAETIALSKGGQEVEWLVQLLEYMGIDMGETTVVKEDNRAAIELTKDPKHQSRAKHIAVRHMYMRDLVSKGKVRVEHCPSKEMIADILTKALPADVFENLRGKFGLERLMCNVACAWVRFCDTLGEHPFVRADDDDKTHSQR